MPPSTIDEQINQALAPASKAFFDLVFVEVPIWGVGVPLVVLWLLAGAIFFTLYFKFVNVRGIPLAIRSLRGEFDEDDAPGEITHFQALTTAISAPSASETSAALPWRSPRAAQVQPSG